MMNSSTFTIGRLAQNAGVGVETVRYYQRRKLLPVPQASGAVRRYPPALVERIRFIKRAQALGFSLDEIAELLRLHDGSNRGSNRISIRKIAALRLNQIETKLADLARMRQVLRHLVAECEHAGAEQACPIIATLSVRQETQETSTP